MRLEFFSFCIYKTVHNVCHWWQLLLFSLIYKNLFFARHFYIHKAKQSIIFTYEVYNLKAQIPRALLSNKNGIVYI